MTIEQQNQSLKTALMVMSIMLVTSFVYNFKFAKDTKNLILAVEKVKTQQQLAVQKLQKLEVRYGDVIAKD